MESTAVVPSPEAKRKSLIKVSIMLILMTIMSGLFILVPIDWAKLGVWGYAGVFVVTFFATASLIVPIPYMIIIARAGMFMDPLTVGLVAGLAATLGEMVGYILGASGRGLVPSNNKWYQMGHNWVEKYGFWCILFLAFIPNPFIDMVGLAAGILRYHWWKFFTACLLGKSGKFILAAMSSLAIPWACTLVPVTCEFIRTRF